jgi:D-amino-acid dehydrogenase
MQILGELGRVSRGQFDQLLDDLGQSKPPTAAGVADLWHTAAAEADAEAETKWMERLGFATESLSGDALRARDPAWGPRVRGAVIHKDGLCLDPASLCDAIHARVIDLGGHITRGCVTDLTRRDGRWLATLHGGRCLTAPRLVIAAGTWSPPLARMLGARIALQAAKGYHVTVTLARQPIMAGVLREPKIAVTPIGGTLRLAGTLELSGINFRIVPHRLAQLARGAASFLPEVAGASIKAPWCGLRPCTANGLPIIGPIGPGAWLATGHGMMGVTLATGTASLIMQDMLGESPPAWSLSLRPKASASLGR